MKIKLITANLKSQMLNSLRLLLCTLFIATVIISCTKDDNVVEQNQTFTTELPDFSNYQWTSEEKKFFSLDNKLNLTSLRDENTIGISPQILKAYSFVAEENERDNFATKILENVGYPLWVRGYTFTSKPSGEVKLTLIPLVKSQPTNISGVLAIYEDLSGIVLNGITRIEALSIPTQKAKPKHGYLKYLNKQEVILFGEASIEVKTALCDIEQIIINNEFEPFLSEGLTAGVDCYYEWKELCIDKENGYSWFNGIENIPVEFDHDQDGIVNDLDQDWRDLTDRYNITQVQFSVAIKEYWEENFEQEYGDYEDFFSTIEFDPFGGEYSLFLEDLYDWLGDYFEIDWEDPFDDLYYHDPFDDIHCWDGSPLQNENEDISTRDIVCNYFWIWNCELISTPWWIFIHGFEDENAVLNDRLNDYFEVNNLVEQVSFSTLKTIAQNANCDPFSVDFEQCVKSAYENEREEQLLAVLDQFQVYPNVDLNFLYSVTLDCKLDFSISNSFLVCVASKFQEFYEKIDQFVLDHTIDTDNYDLNAIINFECNYSGDFNKCAFESLAIYKHEVLTSLYIEYQDASVDINYYILEYGAEEYLQVADLYHDFRMESEDAAPEFIPVYFIKKLAEASVGLFADIGVQLVMEYWMGDHDSFVNAWQELEINYVQAAFSAAEATMKNKYASVIASAFADGILYISSTAEEDFSWEAFGASIGFGAISAFIGDAAASYVQDFAKYFIKYGPATPTKKLQELGIDKFFFKFKDFRNLFIKYMWLNNCQVCRGALLEAVQKYGKYADDAFNWVNKNGETNGPLDFIHIPSNKGIQLKTIADADNWSNFKSKAKKGLDQLNLAIANGDVTTGRLDIMMPEELSANFAQWKIKIDEDFIQNTNFPEYSDLEIIIGSFLD